MATDGSKARFDQILAGDRVLIMGIVNATPDSFSDGGHFHSPQAAVEHALKLQEEGADLLDIGGESTRPGADPVTVEEELARVMPVLEGLKSRVEVDISIDTRKAEVMRQTLEQGADMINDVTALQYEEASLAVVAASSVPLVLMHGKGDPKIMQDDPTYENVVREVYDYLQERLQFCEKAGIARERLIIDPGIGFGKTLAHNLALLANLDQFKDLGVPLLLGVSRKRFIGDLSGETNPLKRAPGSIATALAGVEQGVRILRVHDVKETRQALDVWQAISKL